MPDERTPDVYWLRLEAAFPPTYTPQDRALIRRAYELAREAHKGQKRASGDPYISHCVAVAEILLELHVPPHVVAAGLLHDVLEDTDMDFEQLRRKMGMEVARLVEGVTKLDALPRVSNLDRSQVANGDKANGADTQHRTVWRRQLLTLENLRKIFLSMWDDIFIVPIKLADRLHNMRTLQYLPPEKRRRIARETLEIFAPLAHRLGITVIQRELEDLAFRYVEPDMYRRIETELRERGLDDQGQAIQRIIERIQEVLRQENVHARVQGRPKHLYSIYRKMQRKGVDDLSRVHDIRGVRIILPMQRPKPEEWLRQRLQEQGLEPEEETFREMLEQMQQALKDLARKPFELVAQEFQRRYRRPHTVALAAARELFQRLERERKRAISECYRVLGIVHTHWKPIHGTFDDYIANPKPNGYQSLHTAVIFDDGKPLEVQIRTEEMHEVAEYGMAAHWAYKEQVAAEEEFNRKLRWFRSLLEWRKDVDDPADFMEGVKSDLFGDRVYVFTPKGDIIELPKGATPIDFAYYIHTEVGHRCRGAKVNGRWVPLSYQLQTGDIVEIITSKQGGPSRDWLNPELGLVKTQRARSKIRRWFRQQDREKNLQAGRKLFQQEIERLGLDDVDMEDLLAYFNYHSEDELFVALGCGDLSIQRIVSYLNELQTRAWRPMFTLSVDFPQVKVEGLEGVETRMAQCCKPEPPDRIVGYITQNRGISIHKAECPNFLTLQVRRPERVIRAEWGVPPQTIPVYIRVEAYDRPGLMRDVSHVIAQEGLNIRYAHVDTDDPTRTYLHLVVGIRDLMQLHRLLHRIESVNNVKRAQRLPLARVHAVMGPQDGGSTRPRGGRKRARSRRRAARRVSR